MDDSDIEIAKPPENWPETGLSGWELDRLEERPTDDPEKAKRWRQKALMRGINPDTGRPMSAAEEATMPSKHQEWREKVRKSVGKRLQAERDYFLARRDPTVPWNAFLLARSWNIPVPDWVLDYLDQAGRDIIDIFEKGNAGKKAAESVGRVLNFGGDRPGDDGLVAEARLYDKYEEIADEVFDYMEVHACGADAARQEVANRRGINLSTVGRAHRLWVAERAQLSEADGT
jgi:hypothetical protein